MPRRSGATARLDDLPRLWRQLRHARSWQPVLIFYALVVGAAAVQVATVELAGHVLEITGHDVALDLDGIQPQRDTDLEPLIDEFAAATGSGDDDVR